MKNFPSHIAIIPDGNRRWTKKQGLPVFEGHRVASEKTLPKLIEKAQQLGVKYFTFWALSTENLKNRTKEEIEHLFNLIRYFLKNKTKELHQKNLRIKVIGDLAKLPRDIQTRIKKVEELTKKNSGMMVIFAINYGGRDEIIRAIKKAQSSKLKAQSLTKENFVEFLDTAGIPDPDLIIRTGGEIRLSGFMLWQSEYSELYFSDVLFPDFSEKELEKAVLEFSHRQRRFGK